MKSILRLICTSVCLLIENYFVPAMENYEQKCLSTPKVHSNHFHRHIYNCHVSFNTKVSVLMKLAFFKNCFINLHT